MQDAKYWGMAVTTRTKFGYGTEWDKMGLFSNFPPRAAQSVADRQATWDEMGIYGTTWENSRPTCPTVKAISPLSWTKFVGPS